MNARTDTTPRDEQLQLAFRQLRRPGWPATLEQALADPLRAPIITCVARDMGRAPWRSFAANRPRLCGGTVPPTPETRGPPKRATKGATKSSFDAKRAAANDFD